MFMRREPLLLLQRTCKCVMKMRKHKYLWTQEKHESCVDQTLQDPVTVTTL